MSPPVDRTVRHEGTQRLDGSAVAKLYDVPLPVIAKAIGVKANALRKHPDSRAVQDRLAVLVDCFGRIYDVMLNDENAVRRWLNRPNHSLDGMRPLALLEAGRLSELRSIATQVETESFA